MVPKNEKNNNIAVVTLSVLVHPANKMPRTDLELDIRLPWRATDDSFLLSGAVVSPESSSPSLFLCFLR